MYLNSFGEYLISSEHNARAVGERDLQDVWILSSSGGESCILVIDQRLLKTLSRCGLCQKLRVTLSF